MKVLLLVMLALAACGERDIGKRSAPIEIRFDHPVPDAVVVRAIAILEARLGVPGIVKQHGDSILIDANIDLRLSGIDEKLSAPATVLRIEDSESPYLEKLVKHVKRDSVAEALELEAVTDLGIGEARLIERFVKATDDYRHVNVAWAAKHRCDGKREPGRGVFCSVTGEQQLSAYFHGDKELFVEPIDPEFATPEGTELVFTRGPSDDPSKTWKAVWRTRLLERAPITVDNELVGSADRQGGHIVVSLTPNGAPALTARASGKRILLMNANAVFEGTLSGSTLTFATTDSDVVYALSLAALPAKLVIVSATR